MRASDGPWPSPSPRCRHPPSGGSWHGPSSPTLRAETASLGCVDHMHRFRALSLVRAPSATSSPNLVARWVARRLPLMRPENRACFGGYRVLRPSIAGEQPKLCRSAAGNPSSRSLRSNGRHSDGNATAPPDSAPFRSYSCDGMRRECMCVCASVQVAPILRIPPRKPCDLSGASLTTRTRRLPAVSTWRGSRNGTSLPYVQI